MSPRQPLLLGHRGARAVVQVLENTPASFDLALQHGADGFEFDVRRTVDGCAVICHDPQSGGREILRTRSEGLSELPRLEDVLARYRDTAFLDIELKVAGLEENVLALLKQHSPRSGYVISSFLPRTLQQLHAQAAEAPLGFICDQENHLALWNQLPISHVMPHYRLLSQDRVAEIHGANRKVFAWTVNQPEDMLRLRDWQVDAIISDDTELLVRTLRPA
jgi:glycerophosphoryl diester phosphodiesterase